jgi:hypothetical protein
LADNLFGTRKSPPTINVSITGDQTHVDTYERIDRLTAENGQVNICSCRELAIFTNT